MSFFAKKNIVTDINTSRNTSSSLHQCFFLIGFMGSGKSYWGKIWATANQLSFIDLDEEIEKQQGDTIARIFALKGEAFFRKTEAAVLRTCIKMPGTIVACGGGAPCFYDNMQWMNAHGITVYVECSPAEIAARLITEQEKRPLIKNLNPVELLAFIEKKLAERHQFYSMATITAKPGLLAERSFLKIISPVIS